MGHELALGEATRNSSGICGCSGGLDVGKEEKVELLIGVGCLLVLYWVICMLGHGYANTVDSIALFLHRHAERVKRMHASRESQIRGSWLAERRRMKEPPERRPVPIQQTRRAS